jgi:hypothetical protein
MFNPNPKIQLIPIPGHHPCIVIDDFMLDPQSLVDVAVKYRDGFSMAPYNAFPGLELRMPDAFSARLNEFFIQHMRNLLGVRRTETLYSRLSMMTLQPHQLSPYQRLCHRDRFTANPTQCFAASVLYLFHDATLGGTSFYAPKMPEAEVQRLYYSPDTAWRAMSNEQFTQMLGTEPGYMVASNDYFELICTVPPAWNRAIFYDGSIFHSAHVAAPARLDSDPARGRLTLNGFFTCRRTALA